ncbi:uncharacterized protein HMPREF1541_05198 [Cyphellophora europaea CBS 101466]|uniref:Major facilitator superfamily (MFS) profile domain-containing protein n=1 Tax=Cyphellophora europaea (strain CBS 101466) TaxID=1220924 RepID=W2RYT4_CYPE1|nr:uncharacterized protein HMPREF1541_05198 [Cyphellophora europaea CBS 101466]ETN40918.1 hypothetical protein HMPREF1541_05198 [Cyphellophora europaea CBS 101466]
MVFFDFKQARREVEAEGVYIGGWGIKEAIIPRKYGDASQDRAEEVNAVKDWSEAEERRLVRKLDLRVLFPCCIVYFLAYLDRANMGYASTMQSKRPDNINVNLGLVGAQFNWAVSVTYFSVTALLLPSNLLMKKISGKRYFPIIMVLFGTVVCTIAATKNAAGLLAGRFFLGIPEAGVVSTCLLYFSFWYKPSERALRLGIFHAANSLASGVGGFLAVGVDRLNGVAGLESWRWLFLIEGLMPIVMSVPVYFMLLTFPEDSKALSERERHIAINRFGRGATRRTDATWSWPVFWQVITRPSTQVFFVAYVCVLIVATALGTFLPVIFNNFLDFSSTKSNVYTSAIYFVALAEYYLWSLHSDATRDRMWHYLFPIIIAIPCFAVWTHVSINQSYGSIKPIALYGLAFLGKSVSICQPAALAYRSATLYGATEQAVGGAVAVASLSVGSIIGPQIFPHADAPWYLPGFAASLATLSLTLILYASLPFWYLWEAQRRKRKYGHAMPLKALEDAGRAMTSEAARLQEQERQVLEEKGLGGDVETARHVEEVVEGGKEKR